VLQQAPPIRVSSPACQTAVEALMNPQFESK
jgi:hypothetical protein